MEKEEKKKRKKRKKERKTRGIIRSAWENHRKRK